MADPEVILTMATFDNHSVRAATLFNFSYWEAYNIILNQSRVERRIFSPTVEIFLVTVYGLITTTGILCNVVVCFVMGRSNQRKMPRNMYIINLAISDLALSVICTPFTLVLILQRNWTLGSFLCKLLPVVQGANILVSTATITVIAIDRYFAIVTYNACQRSLVTRRHQSLLVCVGIWIMAVALTFPLAFFQAVEDVTLHEILLWQVCVEKWPRPRIRGYYTLFIMIVQYVIPIAVLTTNHVRITRHLYLRHLHIAPKRTRHELRRNRRATIMLMIVAAVFAASWLPLHVFSLLVDFDAAKISVAYLYAGFAACHSCAMTSACSNPVLYGWLNTNFRREASKFFSQKCLSLDIKQFGQRSYSDPYQQQSHSPTIKENIMAILTHKNIMTSNLKRSSV